MARKKPGDVLDKLKPEEAQDVLCRLLDERRDLLPEVERNVGCAATAGQPGDVVVLPAGSRRSAVDPAPMDGEHTARC